MQEEIFVARAPGRLDVMGGIADYSGSLVLQVQILFYWYLYFLLLYHPFIFLNFFLGFSGPNL